MIPFFVAILSLVIMLVAWTHYLWLIPQERVPERPVAHAGAMGLSIGLALIAPVLNVILASELAVFEAPLELSAIAGAVGFFYLMSQAPLPDGSRLFNVGDVLPEFAAIDHDGQPFASDSLRGKRVLLKFYRGYW